MNNWFVGLAVRLLNSLGSVYWPRGPGRIVDDVSQFLVLLMELWFIIAKLPGTPIGWGGMPPNAGFGLCGSCRGFQGQAGAFIELEFHLSVRLAPVPGHCLCTGPGGGWIWVGAFQLWTPGLAQPLLLQDLLLLPSIGTLFSQLLLYPSPYSRSSPPPPSPESSPPLPSGGSSLPPTLFQYCLSLEFDLCPAPLTSSAC